MGTRAQHPIFLAVEEPEAGVVREQKRVEVVAGVGFRARDGFEVLLAPAVLADAYRWGAQLVPHEGYALLAGYRGRDDRGEYVFIGGFVPDLDAIATRTTVRTTPRSEAVTREKLRAMFPDAEEIGWLHPHPGYGAFFSETDRATQASWGEPYQVGIVVDPIRREVAIFRGPQAEELLPFSAAERAASELVELRALLACDLPQTTATTPPEVGDAGPAVAEHVRPELPATGEPVDPGLRACARRIANELLPPFAFASLVGVVIVSGLLVGHAIQGLDARLARIEGALVEQPGRTATVALEPGEAWSVEPATERGSSPAACTAPMSFASLGSSKADPASEVRRR